MDETPQTKKGNKCPQSSSSAVLWNLQLSFVAEKCLVVFVGWNTQNTDALGLDSAIKKKILCNLKQKVKKPKHYIGRSKPASERQYFSYIINKKKNITIFIATVALKKVSY